MRFAESALTIDLRCTLAEVNRLAHWLLSRGLKRGDTLALYM